MASKTKPLILEDDSRLDGIFPAFSRKYIHLIKQMERLDTSLQSYIHLLISCFLATALFLVLAAWFKSGFMLGASALSFIMSVLLYKLTLIKRETSHALIQEYNEKWSQWIGKNGV